MRVAVVRRRDERFLDRTRTPPAQQVQRRAGLVVRARRTRAPERLLTHDRPGRLVVDVEVAGGEAQHVARTGDRRAVLGDDRAGEPVRRGRLHLGEYAVVVAVVIYVEAEDRPEVLRREDLVGWIRRGQHGRPDEPARAVVVAAAGYHAHRVAAASPVDGRLVLAERAIVDHRAHEQRQIRRDVSYGEGFRFEIGRAHV